MFLLGSFFLMHYSCWILVVDAGNGYFDCNFGGVRRLRGGYAGSSAGGVAACPFMVLWFYNCPFFLLVRKCHLFGEQVSGRG